MKRITTVAILTVAAIVLTALPAAADILEMKDGTVIEGKYVGGSQNNVRFEVAGEIKVFNLGDVLTVTFTGNRPSGGAPAASAAPPAAAVPAAAPAASTVTVPAGTRLMIRTNETIDSKTMKTGHRFVSSLEADLVVEGKTVAPRGSKVYGVLTEAKKSRRMTGKSELKVTFTDIMVNNQMIPIKTGELQAKSEGTGKKTVGRAARGALIGGAISGSSGAKTGAKVGAGVSLLTSGEQVYIPSGTLLEVNLAEPLTL